MLTTRWFGLLVFNGTFSTNRLYRAIEVWIISQRDWRQDKYIRGAFNKFWAWPT